MDVREKLEVIAHLGDHISYKEDIGICYDSTLAKVIEDAYMALKNGVTVQEWISVEDRLPEETDKYLVAYHDYDRWTIRDMWFFTEYKGYELKRGAPCWVVYDSEYGDIDYTKTVTHWMPLPQPPKGE